MKENLSEQPLSIRPDTLLFFHESPAAFSLYEAFESKLLSLFPNTEIRVQKTQISFYNRHLFACVSLQRVRKKVELPNPYLVVTLGLPFPLASPRVAQKTEPYPGRWTCHIVIGSTEEMDEELFSFVQQAYHFANKK